VETPKSSAASETVTRLDIYWLNLFACLSIADFIKDFVFCSQPLGDHQEKRVNCQLLMIHFL
jgi:hypothetical protein